MMTPCDALEVPTTTFPKPRLGTLALICGGVTTTGFTVSAAVRVVAPFTPVIVTLVLDVTAWVVTVNVALELPEFTVTFAGTDATAALLLESVMVNAAGAAPLSDTVPVTLLPPVTELDESE